MRERILVAGGGIAGLTAALALDQKGFAVELVERSAVLDDAGAGIQLSPNAMHVLIGLGLGPALAPFLVEPEAIIMRRARDGVEIVRLPLAEVARRWGAPYAVIHRSHLQRALHDAAAAGKAIAITHGATVTAVTQTSEGVSIEVEGRQARRTLSADVAICADGLWSGLAGAAGQGVPPAFSGKRAWRSIVPVEEMPAEWRKPVTTLWLGTGGHVVTYPISAGKALNIVAVVSDARSTGGWSQAETGADLLSRFQGWTPALRELLGHGRDWRSWPLFDRRVIGPMARGRIALIGDAAHPVLPFLAQGGAMAIEDAAVMAGCLAREGTVSDRLGAYVAARLPRLRRVQREAVANGARYHWGWPLSEARDAAMRLAGGGALLRRYDWLYGWRAAIA